MECDEKEQLLLYTILRSLCALPCFQAAGRAAREAVLPGHESLEGLAKAINLSHQVSLLTGACATATRLALALRCIASSLPCRCNWAKGCSRSLIMGNLLASTVVAALEGESSASVCALCKAPLAQQWHPCNSDATPDCRYALYLFCSQQQRNAFVQEQGGKGKDGAIAIEPYLRATTSQY